jgi:hypothetical protein
MSASLKKLWNNYGIGAIVMAVILMYVIVLFYQYFTSKGSSGKENLNSYTNSAYSNGNKNTKMASGGSSYSGVKPANPSGQNETFASVKNNGGGGGGGIPSACNKQTIQNPNDLLPKDKNSEWAQLNPAGQGDLSNINLLKAGYHIGIDTIGQTLRNANLQIRSEPANPQINVGPWNLSTIEPDFMRPPLELGQGIQ